MEFPMDNSESKTEPELDESALLLDKQNGTKDGSVGSKLSPSIERIIQSFKSDFYFSKAVLAVILVSFSFGSAVIILPNTVYRLGPVVWTIFVALILVCTTYATYLNNRSCNFLLENAKSLETIRDPYPAIAELSGGPVFRKVFTAFMYIAMVTNSLALILLAATMMNNSIPLGVLSYYNSIRVWLTIIFVAVSPMMFLGSFSDLKATAILSVAASSISLLCILASCVIITKNHYYNIDGGEQVKQSTPTSFPDGADAFVVFGLIIFASAGPSFSLPNILIHVKDRKQMPATIVGSFSVIFAIYIFAGIIPYTVFGHNAKAMITESFSAVIQSSASFPLAALGTLCDISMSLHLILEAVLIINPVYQHVEHSLNIPKHMTWKRICFRTCILLIMLSITLAIPRFRPLLSLVGAVPLTLVGVIFPIYIYSRLFETNTVTKAIHVKISLLFVIFVLGNIGVSVSRIAYFILK